MVREPDNFFDRNAIKIVGFSERALFLGLMPPRERHIGYVPADLARELVEEYFEKNIPIGCELYAIYVGRDGYIDVSFMPLRPPKKRHSKATKMNDRC